MTTLIRDGLVGMGVSEGWATLAAVAAVVTVAYAVAGLIRAVSRGVMARVMQSRPIWHEKLTSHGLYRTAARTLVVVGARLDVLPALEPWPRFSNVVDKALLMVISIGLTVLVIKLVDVVVEVFETRDTEGRLPVRVMGQALVVVVCCYATIIVLSILTGQDVSSLLTSVTALGAVLVYVFRDLILGWTAAMQIVANDLLRDGDWISLSAGSVDGEVLEVGITTVKVRNWDRTVSAVPTYSLVSEGFRNHQSMVEAGARRLTLALTLEATAVREVDEAWVTERIGEVEERPVTNVCVFRRWLRDQVAAHPLVRADELLLVRLLEPTPEGLPVQVYGFVSDTRWSAVEDVRAELLERAVAALTRFDLRLYQAPTTQDLRAAVR